MRFCQAHWDKLRHAIAARGLNDFVPQSGEEAMGRMVKELEGHPTTRETFDPLMAAHNMIFSNTLELLGNIGANPLELLYENTEHPERECPICYLNWISAEHDRTCTNPNCTKEKGQTFEHFIELAANGAAEYAKTLKPA